MGPFYRYVTASALRLAPRTPTPRPARGHVLIVDDEPGLVRAYRRHLESAGYAVSVAYDSDAAIAAFQQGEVDAVLTDIAMPGTDGMQLFGNIREQDADVPVVLATGSPSVETAIRAMDLGALKYLVKPVNPRELVEVMERAVHLSRMANMKREALALLGDVGDRLSDHATLEAVFHRALDELYLLYQPIVCLSERRVFGYEALVRSREPELPHPGALFEAAEKLHRVQDLGRAIRAISTDPLEDSKAMLFLNLHPEDLADERLLDCNTALAHMADRVVLEVTERASLDRVPDARTRIAALREMGFRIAVDDLGAGYAGLSSFALLEPDVAKLDMALVRDVHRLPTKQKLIRSMTALCLEMGMSLVAEGVETLEELNTLVDLGCDLFQGYYFARPSPPFADINWPPG